MVCSLDWPGYKMRDFEDRLEEMGWASTHTLFLSAGEVPEYLARVCWNLEGVDVVRAEDLVVYVMLKRPRVVMDARLVGSWFRVISKWCPPFLRWRAWRRQLEQETSCPPAVTAVAMPAVYKVVQ